MIYSDAHVRYRESQSWSLRLQPEESDQSRERQQVDGCPVGAKGQQRFFNRILPDLEAEEVLGGALKITQRVMVKRRRSYWSV